jgi:adenosine deaminase
VCARVCACACACACACVYVCVSASVSVSVYVSLHRHFQLTHAYTTMQIHAYTTTQIHAYTTTNAHTNAHTNTQHANTIANNDTYPNVKHTTHSHLQVPRIYDLWKRIGRANNFQEVLNNIFKPLFRVTIDPSSNPTLHEFLKEVSGFDSVDDESKLETGLTEETWEVNPTNWDRSENPPYSYYMYYMWANLHVLNQLRQKKGYVNHVALHLCIAFFTSP